MFVIFAHLYTKYFLFLSEVAVNRLEETCFTHKCVYIILSMIYCVEFYSHNWSNIGGARASSL